MSDLTSVPAVPAPLAPSPVESALVVDPASPASPASPATDPAAGSAVVDLLGMLAYAELLAFDQMAADARLAPDLNRRAVLSEMAGLEIANYRHIAVRLAQLGADPAEAMEPFRAALDAYHHQTEPSSWLEALTKAYVGDSIADDFVREAADLLGPTDRRLILDVLHDSRYAQYAADEIRGALRADPSSAHRLSMWARRLVGEALTQAQHVAADRPSLASLLIAAHDPASLVRILTTAHTARMAAVGLNN